MAKIAIVHNSKYGASKKYAGWITEETGGDLYDAKRTDVTTLRGYDVIVYCAGLYASKMSGIKNIKKNFSAFDGTKFILAAVGAGVSNPGSVAAVETVNLTPEMREKGCKVFLFRGGFDYPRMKAGDRLMMSIIVEILKRRSFSENEVGMRDMVESFGKRVDFSDRSTIKPLVLEALKGGRKNAGAN